MPEAPATQPRPNEGTCLTSGRRPSTGTSRVSIDGAATPVTEVKKR